MSIRRPAYKVLERCVELIHNATDSWLKTIRLILVLVTLGLVIRLLPLGDLLSVVELLIESRRR